jgi:hypothetical protein
MEILKLKVIGYFKQYWRGILIGVCSLCALLAIVFSAIPLIPIMIEYTSIEYTTELKQEPYTAVEPYVDYEVREKAQMIANGFYLVVPMGIEIAFPVGKPEARLVGQFDNSIQGSFTVFDVYSHIVFETLSSRGSIDLPLAQGQYRVRFRENLMWGEELYLNLAVKWSEAEPVTKYREVVKYREIMVTSPNYVKTSRVEKVNVWKYIFG